MKRTVFSPPTRNCHAPSDRDGRAPGPRASRPLTASADHNVPIAPSLPPHDLSERDARAPRLRRTRVLLLALVFLLTAPWLNGAASMSAESPLLEINTGARPPGVSAAATADLVINTRGSGAVGYFNSAYLTIDTRDTGGLSVPVKAVDGLGGNLAGVTVTARQNGLTVASVTTGGNGAATLAGLFAGYYELRAEKAGHLTQVRAHQRVPEDVLPALAFTLTTPPGTPALANSASPPVASVLAGLNININQSTQLKLFQPGNGTFVSFVRPDAGKMTVVLTHGCESRANAWPLDMARKLAQMPGLTAKANIMAWDWEAASHALGGSVGAGLFGVGCLSPGQNTHDQGLALGQALWDALGGGTYVKPVHFLGHSLGTLVNSAAANYLHGDPPNGHPGNQLPTGATPWDWRRTHMTLFDEAELAHIFRLLPGGQSPASPLPKNCAYLENFMTTVGFYSPKGVNVYLQRSKFLSLTLGHSYPYEWYQQTIDLFITDPARKPPDGELGFHHSFELAELTSTPAAFPFPIPGSFQDGALFAQDEQSSREVDLVHLNVPEGLAARAAIELFTSVPFGATVLNYSLKATRFGVQVGTFVVDSLTSTAAAAGRKFGNVVASLGEAIFGDSGSPVYPLNGRVYLDSATTPAVLGIPGYANSLQSQPAWGLQLGLQTQPPPPPLGPQSRGVRPADPTPAPTNTPAYVWLPVQVPSNAVALVFDFTLSGDGASDRVVAGINASNLFSLATQFIATNTAMSSGPLPVERWAGQDVELFLGVAGGTSTNALLSVSGIRFLSLPLPLLVARNSGPNAVVSWTESAPGFVLEYATNLTAAAASWTAITNVAGYVGQRVFTNQTAPSGGFYRLRRP